MKRDLERIVERKGTKFLLRVETSSDHREYEKYEKLREEIWHFPQDNMPGTRNMMCENYFFDGSSLFIGVFVESEDGGFNTHDAGNLVGFSYGFVGVKDKKLGFRSLENLQFYSQYTGVKPGFQNLGLGISIKEFQREKLMDLFGINTVTCTYDPLTGINAYRNVHHFRMKVVKYRVDLYKDFGGSLNREDIPSDRFVVSWDLRAEPCEVELDLDSLLRTENMVVNVDYTEIMGRSGSLELEVIKSINLSLESDFLLVEIPLDYYRMLKETDIQEPKARNIPLDWRMQTRRVFQDLMERGYEIIDFVQAVKDNRKRNFYVMKRSC